ncbi:MAG: 1-acyl-sn-glycerol-3-phosphate acyltransferase [Bacilli bacterium]|nr:1-acyl-sn-glycerol-3-phosphate acyltransferase [Bacilli bacterium]
MERKLVIGIDADGVLTDMHNFNLRKGKIILGRNPVNPNGYNIKEMFNASKLEMLHCAKVLPEYFNDEPPREGTEEFINKLNNDGEELHEITARMFVTNKGYIGKKAREAFEKWLSKNNLRFKSIQYCSETNSPRDKYIACNKLDVDIMIEDKPEVANYLNEKGVKVLLFDNPYNQDVKGENITRIYNWDDAYTEIRKFKMETTKKVPASNFEKIKTDERIKLDKESQVEYLKDYKTYLKNIKINYENIEKVEKKYKLIYNPLMALSTLIFRPIVIGKKNIPYQNGVIFASNHLNSLDQFVIAKATGNRPLTGLAASTIRDTVRGKLFNQLGVVFVDRTNPVSKSNSEDELGSRLVNNKDIIIFPEGTRKNKDKEGKQKEQLKFKYGTVNLAQVSGCPIVPISIKYGLFSIVRVGEPIIVKKTDDFLEKHNELENTILTMTRENNKSLKKVM